MELSGINWSNLASYQAFFESEFATYLVQQGSAAKTQKNYRTDLRHFLSWTILTIQSTKNQRPSSVKEFLSFFTSDFLGSYKRFLVENRIAPTTANRRLSTVRTFCRFCQEKGWLNHNPASTLQNLTLMQKPINELEEMLKFFQEELKRSGASRVTIKNYTSDIKQFLAWLGNINE
ncbi:MAG: site-specific integrase [Patescibacteria group bacterium]